jgi:hypothetical protein
MDAIAYCYRSGRVRVGKRCPPKALAVARGPIRKLRAAVQVLATHGWEKGVYLVPMLPLAETGEEAFAAVEQFATRLKETMAR